MSLHHSGAAFGEARIRRVRAARAALRQALVPWGLQDYGSDCLLTFAETEEWLIGCGDSVDGFESTGESIDDALVLWQGASFALSDQLMPYEEVKLALVGTVGTRTTDAGDTTPVLILQDYDALRENHPAFEGSPLDEWLGLYVHEGFHAHQLFHPSVRAVMEAITTSEVNVEQLGAFYEANEDFRADIQREYALLREASLAGDAHAARVALGEWVSLYDARWARHGEALEEMFPGGRASEMDAFYTFVEGTARYAEVRFVTSPPVLSALQGDAHFENFERTRGRHPSEVAGIGGIGRKYVYALGMYLCLLLDELQPGWQTAVFEDEGLLVGYVRSLVSDTER